MTTRHLAGQPVIIGGGIAGLLTALHLSPDPVVLLTRAPLGAVSSSELAQGGLAASIADDDSPALHMADTMTAGAGLCDPQIVRQVTEAAPDAIATLERFGVCFDRGSDGTLSLGLEAAHSRKRIVHASGDGTGREIMRALAEAVRKTPSITVFEHVEARRLLLADGIVCGVLAQSGNGPITFPTNRVVMATGGIGGLFEDTTNPIGCWGQGLLMAARAGAALVDLEFIQFHPTALDGAGRPMRLVSEAVRGEGAVLIDETGRRFLGDTPGAELAPRDVVTRGVAAHMRKGHRVFLDARKAIGSGFPERFPAINGFCHEAGIDPVCEPIPIRPAEHYHMGGIAVDGQGRSTVAGLWACGETASTGLHGANRLASNSLIEAAVFARKIAESVVDTPAGTVRRPPPIDVPLPPDLAAIRPIVSQSLGVVRSGEGLCYGIETLLPLAEEESADADPAALALLIAVAALRRTESRGAHHRLDYPEKRATTSRALLTLRDAMEEARELACNSMPLARSA
ncbi:L-aspartate oxidase [Chelativorans sp. YIM 93263]|uniref:L-aspartate oxidase n=1 Tax=Chelativorans sp. YIM 93263 TaxID=2906648 RepID=UPI002378EFF7|nr:L-aspartate oxidase [Chelativorans sp. YIM 93263]